MDDLVPLLILWLVAGLATAYLAEKKGRSPARWFLFGVALWVVALPWALLMRPKAKSAPWPPMRDQAGSPP